jgi:endonuclease-3 related protein
MARRRSKGLLRIYRRLLRARGHAGWWPGETPFEICIGAILTQNTAWSNVEKAITRLRRRDRLSFSRLRALRPSRIAPLIRSSGYFNVKARRLAAFLRFLGREYGGEVARMAAEEPAVLRRKLLAVTGIGRETADSIVLYAAGLPLFVVDAYTRRVFSRLGLIRGDEDYDEIQGVFMRELPADPALYNDFHAQVVLLGKDHCRPRPRCSACPLDTICPKRGLAAWPEPPQGAGAAGSVASSCAASGSRRMRRPVAAKTALNTAGAVGGTGGSPTPNG